MDEHTKQVYKSEQKKHLFCVYNANLQTRKSSVYYKQGKMSR